MQNEVNEIWAEVTSKEIELMRHALGIYGCTKRSNWGFRNHFCADSGTQDDLILQSLARRGFVRCNARPRTGMNFYQCTVAGCSAAGLGKTKSKKVGVSNE